MKKQLTLMLFALVILLGIIGNIFGLSRTFTPQATIRFVNSSPANPKFPKGEGYTPLVQFGKPALKCERQEKSEPFARKKLSH
jgi:hypothetical protein